MKELEINFLGRGQVKGIKFSQIKKTENGYIYELNDKGRVYYEVFKRKENVRYSCISYPTNKGFGIWAWTTPYLDRANDILEDINVLKEV
jgi:hypothetical protein